MDLAVRPITEAEFETFRAKLARGFGSDPYPEEDGRLFRATLDLDRTVCAFDGDEMIGTCAAYTFDLTVPGGMGGVEAIERLSAIDPLKQTSTSEAVRRGRPW